MERRKRLGAPLGLVAQYAGVDETDILEWERRQSVPWRVRGVLNRAVWMAARDQVLEECELPVCEWVAAADDSDPTVLEEYDAHYEECDACQVRSEYVEAEIGSPPLYLRERLIVRVAEVTGDLPDWVRAALGGIVVLLLMAGIGVIFFVGLAIINWDASYLGQALALLGFLILGGAAGGITHHITGPLRDRGGALHYLASILTIGGYLLSIMLGFALVGWVVGWENVDPEMAEMVTEPAGWVAAVACIVFFGLVWGYASRDDERGSRSHNAVATKPRASWPRRVLAVVGYAILVFVLGTIVLTATVSSTCMNMDQCTATERALFDWVGLGMTVAWVVVLLAGLMGKLPGARHARSRSGAQVR